MLPGDLLCSGRLQNSSGISRRGCCRAALLYAELQGRHASGAHAALYAQLSHHGDARNGGPSGVFICAAFALTHYEFRGKNFCFFLILGTMMMPGDTLLIINYVTVSRLGLLNTYLGMCITGFVSASQCSSPAEIPFRSGSALSAMIDGCGDLRYILTILMPICKPIITTLFVQSFITIWNAYLWPLIITASAPDMRTIMVRHHQAEFLGGHQLSARAGRRDDLPDPVLHPFRHHATEHGKAAPKGVSSADPYSPAGAAAPCFSGIKSF